MAKEKTPNGSIIIARSPDGTETNVTEAVSSAYDLVANSLDWGSGFLCLEEVGPLAELATICGFEDEGFKDAEPRRV